MIFINDYREIIIESVGHFMRIKPDNLEIKFEEEHKCYIVSLQSNGNLKVIKSNKEEIDRQQAKLISSLANEIIIC